MNEEQLTTLMEKVLTLNVNANTNVDIQGIVDKYMLYASISKLGNTFMVSVVVLVFFWLCYLAVKALAAENERSIDQAKVKKMEELLDNFGKWNEIKKLNKKLDEVLAFMPRNKKPRKVEEDEE